MSKNKIYIIGMPLSGKTTFGKVLAKKLKYEFVDTDLEIENRHKETIPNIIKKRGIKYFREYENFILKTYGSKFPAIFSTGGGIILKKENIKIMKENGIFIFLDVSLEELKKRLTEEEKEKRIIVDLDKLYNQRIDKYKKLADITIKLEQ